MVTSATPGGEVVVRDEIVRAEHALPRRKSVELKIALTCLSLIACARSDSGLVTPTSVDDTPVATTIVAPATSLDLEVGQADRLVATVLDQYGDEMTGAAVGWSSSNPAIATVDGDGDVEAVGAGTANIVAAYQTLTRPVRVNVQQSPPVPTEIVASVTSHSLLVGQTRTLDVTVLDQYGDGMPSASIDWTSSGPAIASVDGNGTVRGVRAGRVTIVAAHGPLTRPIRVTIAEEAPVATEIEVSEASISLPVGQTSTLDATVLDQYGNEMSGAPIGWTSSNPAIATVDGNGTVDAVSAGIVSIVAAHGGLTTSVQVTVQEEGPVATQIVASEASISLQVGQTRSLAATVLDQNGDEMPGASIAWTSSNPAVATVDAGGAVDAMGAGTTNIVASHGALATPVRVTVQNAPPVATEIVAWQSSVDIEVGQTRALTATVLDQYGAEMPGASVVWSTSNPSIATVDGDGTLTGVGAGAANVFAGHGSLSDAVSVTVRTEPAPWTEPAVGNLFSARWTNGTGNGVAAITDGGVFSNPANGEYFGTGTRTLDVVSAASVGLPDVVGGVLRTRIRHQGWGQMTAVDAVPASTTHWGRVYYRSDSGRRSQHGSGYIASAAGGSFNHWQLLSLEHYGGESASDPLQWGIRTASAYPADRFKSPPLSKGTWYRFEWQIEYVSATRVRIWPRIYDLSGNLLYDSDDFRNTEGRSSLTEFWASNTLELGAPEDAPSAEEARDFTIGSEGPSHANGYDPVVPAYIYMAAFDFSSTGWIGR